MINDLFVNIRFKIDYTFYVDGKIIKEYKTNDITRAMNAQDRCFYFIPEVQAGIFVSEVDEIYSREMPN